MSNQKKIKKNTVNNTNASRVKLERVVRRFVVSEATVHSWSTDFTIKEVVGNGVYSPEALIHAIGRMAGKNLEEIKDLEFTVTVAKQTA
jgi:hypothetical protein